MSTHLETVAYIQPEPFSASKISNSVGALIYSHKFKPT